MFKPIVADGRFEPLREELRWLSAVLGDARNIDVVIDRTHKPATLERLHDARSRAGRTVELALASPRSRGLMLDLAEWLTLGDWLVGPSTDSRRDRSIDWFATDCLKRFRRRLKKLGRDLANLDDEGRHGVRIEAKKLRYAAEFFASLVTGKKECRRHTRFREALEALQERLGGLNDLATAQLVRAQVGVDAEAVNPDACDALLIEARVAYKAFIRAKRFWSA